MKIILQNGQIYPFITAEKMVAGGAERQQWLLALALTKHGEHVVVYTLSDVNKPDKLIEGVLFKWITPKSPFLSWPKILRNEQADWWYWRGQDYYLGYLGILAHLYKTKVIFACAFDTDCKPRMALTRRKYFWPAYALGLKMVDRIFVQHLEQYNSISAALRSKSRLVLSFSGDSIPINQRKKYIAWVGVLRETKRPHLLIELSLLLPDVHFVVCGPVSMHRTTSKYANKIVYLLESRKNIEYRGQVSPEDAQDIIRHSALLLSTSSQEGFPNTFLQAWSAGVPVVPFEHDPGGVIKQNNLGPIPQTLKECADVMVELIINQELNHSIGAKCKAYVDCNHSEDIVVKQFLDSLT